MPIDIPKIIAVSLNPCIDRGIEVSGFTIGAHQTGRQLFRRPAGKAVNLAHNLGAFKNPTSVVGFVGKGQQAYFERYLNNEFVSCQLFATAGKTRENITIFDPVANIETHIRDRGFEVNTADVNRLRKKLALLCRKDAFVVFSGSLPPGLSLEDFIELVQICQMNDARVCVDSAGAVLRACKPLGIWMIKPNRLELAEMLGKPLDTRDQIVAAGRELESTVAVAIVTLGKDGAFLFAGHERFYGRVDLDPAEVKNTVGCGDAMLAGFLSELIHGKTLREAFVKSLATATAAAVSLVPGGVHLKDVQRFLDRVECSPLEEVAPPVEDKTIS